MSLKDDVEGEVARILRDSWTEREGRIVPTTEDLTLGNAGVWLDAAILYADMAESTSLVDGYEASFAAEIYKVFLRVAAKIIRSESGEITAYDGDRVMATYIGNSKNSCAARTALKINYARSQIINPAIEAHYPQINFRVKHVTGVDTSSIFVTRAGIRGSNDLVWVGRAANHAAKLSALNADYPSWITKQVYDVMLDSVKTSRDGRCMWEEVLWTPHKRQIYRSTWLWSVI